MKRTNEQKTKVSNVQHITIPAKVLCDEKLTAREKLMFGLLLSLKNEEGYCIACNEWLGELLGVNLQTASNALNNLHKQKHVTLKYEKTPESGITRVIFINPEYL